MPSDGKRYRAELRLDVYDESDGKRVEGPNFMNAQVVYHDLSPEALATVESHVATMIGGLTAEGKQTGKGK